MLNMMLFTLGLVWVVYFHTNSPMVSLKNVLIWWLYLKTDPMNCNRLNRPSGASGVSGAALRCPTMSSKLQKALERYFQAWQDLFYVCFSSCFMFAHFLDCFGNLWGFMFWCSIFYTMMDDSSFHQCRSSKFHIYMSRPTWAFFFSSRVLKILQILQIPGKNWATRFPVLLRFSEVPMVPFR